jgi:drug/metabolite transporter (DMT)-like permease
MLLGTVLLWALNITVTKYVLTHGWSPLAYGTIRYFAAIALFWMFTYQRERSFRIERRDLRLVLFAAAMIFVNQVCFVYGLKLAHASTVALLLGTTPVFIGLISLTLRLEHLSRAFWIGVAATFCGVSLIAASAGGGFSAGLEGDLIAVAAAFTWACYTVTIAPLMRRYSPFRISALVLAIGWVPLALVSIPQLESQAFSFGWKTWLGFGYAVIGPALPDEHPLVHGDRPGRPVARLAVREPPAVLRGALRAPPAVGDAPSARDRRRRPHLRRDRVRADLAGRADCPAAGRVTA